MIVRTVAALLVITALLASVVASQSDTARYQYYDRWYAPTFQTEGSVGAVIIGRSGLQTAIDAVQFGGEMARLSGIPFTAIDLSKSWSGPDTQFIQANDALEHLQVDTLIVQIYADAAREHEKFYELARYSDIWSGTFNYADMGFFDKIQRALSLSLQKWSEYLAVLASGKLKAVVQTERIQGSADPTPDTGQFNAKARSEWIAAVGSDWRKKSWRLWSIDARYDARNRHYYDRIVTLSRQRGVRLVFLYLPQLFEPAMTEDFRALLQQRYGPIEIMAPTISDLEWIYENGFADHGHATDQGQRYITAMFAGQLDRILRGERLPYPAASPGSGGSGAASHVDPKAGAGTF